MRIVDCRDENQIKQLTLNDTEVGDIVEIKNFFDKNHTLSGGYEINRYMILGFSNNNAFDKVMAMVFDLKRLCSDDLPMDTPIMNIIEYDIVFKENKVVKNEE